MTSTRHPGFRGSVEPLVFVIFEMNTGSDYTVPLKKYLHAELRARKVQGRAAIITGAEFNEEAAIQQVARGARGVAFIMPVGGTSYYGSLKQILYDVRVFAITDPSRGEGIQVWRAKVDTNSGGYQFQIDDRLELFAKEVFDRLVHDGILPRTAMRAND